jgi:hypothetical protein
MFIAPVGKFNQEFCRSERCNDNLTPRPISLLRRLRAIFSSEVYKHSVPNGTQENMTLPKQSRALLKTLFHECKRLIEKGLRKRRSRVQSAGSVAP